VKPREPLGFHGVTIACADPAASAEKWRRLLRLPVLRRAPGEVVLGGGPELFVRFVRRSGPARVEEVHLAVDDLAAFRRGSASDALGGDSFSRELDGATLLVRRFARPPRPRWKRKRSRG
jgi:catechol 2,3-dioxygenase-like lactoylglutathione lyase family enzyme